jgi:hypothetical protein
VHKFVFPPQLKLSSDCVEVLVALNKWKAINKANFQKRTVMVFVLLRHLSPQLFLPETSTCHTRQKSVAETRSHFRYGMNYVLSICLFFLSCVFFRWVFQQIFLSVDSSRFQKVSSKNKES